MRQIPDIPQRRGVMGTAGWRIGGPAGPVDAGCTDHGARRCTSYRPSRSRPRPMLSNDRRFGSPATGPRPAAITSPSAPLCSRSRGEGHDLAGRRGGAKKGGR